MGLDMYLTANQYISKYTDKELQDKVAQFFNKNIGEITNITFEVMYWRKANAIHKWFVENVQKGVDDCGSYYVSEDDLIKLRDDIKKVVDNNNLASEVLPPQSGFFFGNTSTDEWYFKSLAETLERLDYILSNKEVFKEVELYYHASW